MPADTGTLPLTVDNTGFLLDKLGEDCHPLQFLRELTQNAIEAIRRCPEPRGDIVWDVDWTAYEYNPSVFKLCIVDNGIGMTGPEMARYINQLSSSGALQTSEGNYGVGAKIAAATRNHAGLIYLSWKDNQGAMIHLWRDPETGQYGLRQIENSLGELHHFGDIGEQFKPELIEEHGTKIILYGNTDEQDTLEPPPEAPSGARWVAKYLNTRYFRLPEGICLRAREGWKRPRSNAKLNKLRRITGQEAYLDAHCQAQGAVALSGARAHWWILRDEGSLTADSSFVESSGHCAALHKDELYELAAGRSGHARLQQFGVIFGQRQVVLYVEPSPRANSKITTNTARTHLLINSEPLPWTDWATEFREKMPAQIDDLMQQIAAHAASSDHLKAVRERLQPVINLFNISRYRPMIAAAKQPAKNGTPPPVKKRQTTLFPEMNGNGHQDPPRASQPGGVYGSYLRKTLPPKQRAKPDVFPEVRWVSVADGTRDPGDIEDKAARFLPEQNLLLINSDFRAFTDMIRHWEAQYIRDRGNSKGMREYIRDSVHDWYEQALTETVIGVQALKGSQEWSTSDIDQALSEESLTAVVMQRYHPYNAVKRQLGTRIGSLKPR